MHSYRRIILTIAAVPIGLFLMMLRADHMAVGAFFVVQALAFLISMKIEKECNDK